MLTQTTVLNTRQFSSVSLRNKIFLANPLRVDFNLPEARNEEKRKRLRMSKL